jgi:type IV pilus assembly protein PilM
MASRHVGVEVSNSAVRIAEIAIGGSRPELVAFGQVSLPPRAVVDGTILDGQAVQAALVRCLREGGFSQTRVHLGVAGLRAITREIDMAALPDSELDAAVRLQALDVIPFPADKTLLSARPLDSYTAADGTTMRRVLLAAAHRDLVDPLIEAIRESGMTPLSVDLTSSALVRSLAHPTTSPQGPEAIVSVGAGLTTVVIHESGVPHFVRTIASGGDAITGAIAATLDLPVGDAEATKRNLDKPGPHIRAAAGAAADASNSLISEIRNSIDYYSTLPGRGDVQQVVVTGGGSRLVGFIERLAQQFRIPVVPGSCLSRIDCSRLAMTPEDLGKIDPLAAVAVGLALPDPVPGAKPFNLVPPEIAIRERQQRTERVAVGVGILLVLMFVGLGVWRFLSVQSAENNVTTLNNQISTLTGEEHLYDKAALQHQQILADEKLALPLVADEVYWPAVLTALAHQTPAGLQIASFSGSSAVPAAIVSQGSPQELQPVTNHMALPTYNDALGVITLGVKGTSYTSFLNWQDAFQNKLSGPLTAGDFIIESLSGITATQPKGNIGFESSLAITGTIQTPRFKPFEVSSK